MIDAREELKKIWADNSDWQWKDVKVTPTYTKKSLTHQKTNVTLDVLDFGIGRSLFIFEGEDISDSMYSLYDEFVNDNKLSKLSKLFKALDDSNLPNGREGK